MFSQSVRTDCLTILFSIVACALMTGCAGTKMVSPNQFSAYEASVAGKSEEARNLLKSEPQDPFTTFLLTCIELSDGNLALSKRYADRFVTANPSVPDGKVLIELIEQRKAYPEESWLTSFVTAWRTSGSPKLSFIDRFLEGKCENCESCRDCKDRRPLETAIGSPDELLSAYESGLACNGETFVEMCLKYSTPDTPLTIRLLSLELLNLGFKVSDALDRRALSRRHELVQELSDEYPAYMKFRIMTILEQTATDEHFSETNIDHLEEAVSRPRLAPLPEDIYHDYLRRFTSFGAENPYLSAASMTRLADSEIFSAYLRKKIQATAETASPELRERLSMIVEKVGNAQIQHKTMISLLMGINMLHSAASIRGDKIAEDHLKKIETYARQLVNQSLIVSGNSYFGPIRPLIIDSIELSMRDEVAFFHLFADIDLPDELSGLMRE